MLSINSLNKNSFICFFIFCIVNTIFNESYALFPFSLFRTYDVNFKTDRLANQKLQFSTMFEEIISNKGRNSEKEEVSIFSLWNKDQNALTMLRGFDPNSEIGQLDSILNMVNDDGIRGHFIPHGQLRGRGIYFNLQYYLPHNFFVELFVPFYSLELKNVRFEDQTKQNDVDDFLIKKYLTKDFCNTVNKLGNGLKIGNWHKSGFGDIVTTVEWLRNFPQKKQVLKNVRLSLRAGSVFPTGVKKDEDNFFSIPFGNDGAWAILFGGGMDLTLGYHARVGADVEFWKPFNTTCNRRIKTDFDQTELLLLAKSRAMLHAGFLQRYNLYFEVNKFFGNSTLRIAYQNLKQSDGKIFLLDNTFSTEVANSAESLQEWVIHEMIFKWDYDFSNYCKDNSVIPNLAIFYKLPFKGKNSILSQTIGFSFSLNF